MLISTKGRYALKTMLELAGGSPNENMPLPVIAESQGISEKYLEGIISVLVKGGLVEGMRGKGGGYRLTRKPEEYSVLEILQLTEESLTSVACLEEGAELCPHREKCRTLSMWKGYDDLTRDYFGKITIQDLL